MNNKEIKQGLRPLTIDPRDFKLGAVFGTIDVKEVPHVDFVVSEPLFWKDQGSTDFCTAYTATEVSEDQEEVELSPEFNYAMMSEMRGDYHEWGGDLRQALMVGVKVGFLAVADLPFPVSDKSRDFLANWKNWPTHLKEKAAQYKKATLFKVDGKHDTFDDIRAALWQHKGEKRTIAVGAIWRDSWTKAAGGIIGKEYEEDGFGHAFKIFGQRIIDGEIYLVAQLSNGTDIGDKGRFYFPRYVVNKEFAPFGQFMYKDMPREDVEYYLSHEIKTTDNWLVQFIKIFINLFKKQ